MEKNKDKKLTIAGNKKDVLEIMKRLVEKFGKDAKLTDVLDAYEKEDLNLS